MSLRNDRELPMHIQQFRRRDLSCTICWGGGLSAGPLPKDAGRKQKQRAKQVGVEFGHDRRQIVIEPTDRRRGHVRADFTQRFVSVPRHRAC